MDAALGLLGLGTPWTINVEFENSEARRHVAVPARRGDGGGGGGGGAVVQLQGGAKRTSVDDEFVALRATRGSAFGKSDGNRSAGGKHGFNAKAAGASIPVFEESESVSGRLIITPKDAKAKPLQHLGIRVEFVGSIELMYESDLSHEFTSLLREVDDTGTITSTRTYTFTFQNALKTYDTYCGTHVRLRYFVRVTILRPQYTPNVVREFDVAVQHGLRELGATLPPVSPIRMEVGIEDALHIEFEYNKNRYELNDVVTGKIYFLLVRVKIKRMEIEIRRRESAGAGSSVYNETDIIAKFEAMDGAPVRGESIPIRLFLSAYPTLTPTYIAINNRFSVKYYLNLVIIDQDDRRYFKQAEIVLWRAAAT